MTGSMGEESAQPSALIAWLDRRAEPAPASLHTRLVESVRATAPAEGGSLVEQSLRAGERLVSRLLEQDCAARSNAPDLLAADAWVTYAFEAAAEDDSLAPRAIEARAVDAMRRIAALGDRA